MNKQRLPGLSGVAADDAMGQLPVGIILSAQTRSSEVAP